MTDSLLAFAAAITGVLDDLGIDWAIGGSIAATYYSEPRSTVDADIAISADAGGTRRLATVLADRGFYVPETVIATGQPPGGSFNVLDAGLKVDLFVLGSGLLDRNQIHRRIRAELPGFDGACWITASEDVVLRKLMWGREAGGSERQWRDVVLLLHHAGAAMDTDYLVTTADELGLSAELEAARAASEHGTR